MDVFVNTIQNTVDIFQINMIFLLSFLGIFWGVHIINLILGYRLNLLGIYPRSWHGVIGIPCSPFLHGNFNHLFFNSVPLIMLAGMVLLGGRYEFYCVTTTIIVLSGMAIWLLGRKAIHIGASSLTMGYFGYLLVRSYEQPGVVAVMIGFILIYYFGGMFASLLPLEEKTSWEGHIFGFIAGIFANHYCVLDHFSY